MIIPDKIKLFVLTKLNTLLKNYLVARFQKNGYCYEDSVKNYITKRTAKKILWTINSIELNEEIEKTTLEFLFDLYKNYHIK